MRYFATIVLALSIHSSMLAQRIIPADASVHISAGVISPMGNTLVKRGDYVAPSLLNNFKQGFSIAVSGTTKLKKQIRGEVQLTYTKLSDWQFDNDKIESNRFQGAEYSSIGILPMIGIGSKLLKTGVWQHLALSAFVGPAINRSTANFDNLIFFSTTNPVSPNKTTIYSFGIAGSTNVDILVSNRSTIGVSADFTHTWISSALFDDSEFSTVAVSLRYGWRLKFDKRYKYSSTW